MCNSIVAILTLEVTGIPEISEDREFPWPKPTFVESTRPFVFEVSLSLLPVVFRESIVTNAVYAGTSL